MLKPRVGEILSMSYPLNFFIIVVLPALSNPNIKRRISFYFYLVFLTIDMKPISYNSSQKKDVCIVYIIKDDKLNI